MEPQWHGLYILLIWREFTFHSRLSVNNPHSSTASGRWMESLMGNLMRVWNACRQSDRHPLVFCQISSLQSWDKSTALWMKWWHRQDACGKGKARSWSQPAAAWTLYLSHTFLKPSKAGTIRGLRKLELSILQELTPYCPLWALLLVRLHRVPASPLFQPHEVPPWSS